MIWNYINPKIKSSFEILNFKIDKENFLYNIFLKKLFGDKMLLLYDPTIYFKEILRQYPKSYLAEDETQAIIGIDCEYISGDDFGKLNDRIKNGQKISNFAGLFGVLSYEAVYKFEKIGELKPALYEFPLYHYSDAKAYLHYDKQSKIYSFYGDSNYFNNLKDIKPLKSDKSYFYTIKSDLNSQKADYLKMIETAKNYIKNGDIFQVVLSKTLELQSDFDPLEFYEILKSQNPSPYMFYYPSEFGTIVGSSPELVVEIKKGIIHTSPIAGTKKRGRDANEDEIIKNELLNDEKELSEHRMLIDLARNDIGKFALPSSVKVINPIHIKLYESVMHIVSDIYAELKDSSSAMDAIATIFPAGTLSGSPKIRAMQIINELEEHSRGIYGGGIGFWHFNGDMQMAILIRSAIFVPNSDSNRVFIGAGAGIVWDSIAQNEYEEICNKRKSCLKIFEQYATKGDK